MRTIIHPVHLRSGDLRQQLALREQLAFPGQAASIWLALAFIGALAALVILAAYAVGVLPRAATIASLCIPALLVAAGASNLLARALWQRDREAIVAHIESWLADGHVRVEDFADFHFPKCQLIAISVTPKTGLLYGVAGCEIVLRNRFGVSSCLEAEFTAWGKRRMDGSLGKGRVRAALARIAAGAAPAQVAELTQALGLDWSHLSASPSHATA